MLLISVYCIVCLLSMHYLIYNYECCVTGPDFRSLLCHEAQRKGMVLRMKKLVIICLSMMFLMTACSRSKEEVNVYRGERSALLLEYKSSYRIHK